MKVKRPFQKMTAVLVGALLSLPGYSAERLEWTDIVQMPIAVDRAVEAGIPDQVIREVARALVEHDVDGRDFNDSIRASAEGLSASDQDPGMEAFAVERVREGLRGRELADAIHARLNERGIPAGGRKGGGPPPIAQDFIPEHARERMKERGAGRRDRDGPGHAGEARDRRGGPDEEAEERRRGPPEGAGEGRRGPPDADDERGADPAEEAGKGRGGPPQGPGDRS